MRDKIKEWKKLVVNGLCNGLTHTISDGRQNDIVWVRGRLQLWEAFGRCVINLENEQNYEYDERELIEISKLGYIKEQSK